MRFSLLILVTLPLYVHAVTNAIGVVPAEGDAADMNGYTALYECRAGGPYCNVDVVALGKRPCDQTITASTKPTDNWSAINQSNDTICIGPGDHYRRGELKLKTSGTNGNYKVLRYTRSGDKDDDPWDQTKANQANVRQIVISGNYWLIHRISFTSVPQSKNAILSDVNTSHHIINRVYLDGGGKAGKKALGFYKPANRGVSDVTVQNSVYRNVGPRDSKSEAVGINFKEGTRMRAVNNEGYNYVAHPIQMGGNCDKNADPPCTRKKMIGLVVENNDFYVTDYLYSDCNGNYTKSGPCAASESVISTKVQASSANPTTYLHNRLWGTRHTDNRLCCNGEGGNAITNYDNNDYLLIKNNIIMDAQVGINNVADYNSYIGNIFYNIDDFLDDRKSAAINRWHSHNGASRYETYLNTFVFAGADYSVPHHEHSNVDTNCNVFISSGPKEKGKGPNNSSIADYNAFYGKSENSFSFHGTDTNIVKSLRTRTNSTSYSAGDTVRWDDVKKCSAPTDAACYLYIARTSGESHRSKPKEPCATLGCSFEDGSITWQAIRGPYAFYRKLQTKPELTIIPYARPYADPYDLASRAPDAYACPSNYASRRGVGVDDI